MPRRRQPAKRSPPEGQPGRPEPVRIIGGRLRGSRLVHPGPEQTRPMKHRTREAIFNLVGPAVKQKQAIDLFAGTGALGLEAISRGAARATFVERHFPTARLIERNIAAMGIGDVCEVIASDTFYWAREATPPEAPPWLVFISPPYDLYVERRDDMLALIAATLDRAPSDSILVVESDNRFDAAALPHYAQWDIRRYAPAIVSVLRVGGAN